MTTDGGYDKIREARHFVSFATVDGVLFEDGKILLTRRATDPYKGSWVLPGGHVDPDETVEQTVVREFREETGLDVQITGHVGVYSDPKRDPRWHTVSNAFMVRNMGGTLTVNTEVTEFGFFAESDLPASIGFDHREIIKDAFKILHSQKPSNKT